MTLASVLADCNNEVIRMVSIVPGISKWKESIRSFFLFYVCNLSIHVCHLGFLPWNIGTDDCVSSLDL